MSRRPGWMQRPRGKSLRPLSGQPRNAQRSSLPIVSDHCASWTALWSWSMVRSLKREPTWSCWHGREDSSQQESVCNTTLSCSLGLYGRAVRGEEGKPVLATNVFCVGSNHPTGCVYAYKCHFDDRIQSLQDPTDPRQNERFYQ